jgi:hypothetical protein
MSDQPRPEPSGPQIDDLLGAFALDAVDPDERELVERHIALDPVARAEVDEMRETAAVLASLPRNDEGAPPGLWDRIAGAITESADRAPAPPVPITSAKRRASISARVVMPIAAAAAIIIAVLAVQVIRQSPDRAGNLAAAYDHAIKNGAAPISLQSADANGGVAAEIALQSDGTGYLRADHLAALPQGKTYQLWALVDRGTRQRAISAGVLGRDPQTAAFHVASKPASFAITVEAVPGVVRPSQSPIAVGKVSA